MSAYKTSVFDRTVWHRSLLGSIAFKNERAYEAYMEVLIRSAHALENIGYSKMAGVHFEDKGKSLSIDFPNTICLQLRDATGSSPCFISEINSFHMGEHYPALINSQNQKIATMLTRTSKEVFARLFKQVVAAKSPAVL